MKHILYPICIFFFTYLWAPLTACAADLNINISATSTGGIIGPLNTVGDIYCPSATTAGCDVSSTDNRVRTHDVIKYKIGVQVGPAGDDVIVTTTLTPGLVIDQIPGGCDPFTSTITGDGSAANPTILVCDLGFQASSALDIFFDARVIGTLPNGTDVGVTSSIVEGPSSIAVTAPAISDIDVTATPRIDLRKRQHSSIPNTRNGELGIDLSYSAWFGIWNNTGIDPLLGHELVTDDITFTEDLSSISPNAYVYQCATTPGANVFPYTPYDPGQPDYSVTDAGSLSCSNTGTTATGSVTVTLTGADLSFEHVPSFNKNGQPLSSIVPDTRVAAFGLIRVFVPLSDITAAGGSLPTTNIFSNLSVNSITNQANFNGDGEDESNNTRSQTLQNNGGNFSHTYRCHQPNVAAPSWCSGNWTAPPTNASSVGSGDGIVEPDQTFATYSWYRNRSFFPDSYVDVCSVFDDRYYEPIKYNANDAARCHGTCGTRNTDYVIEYGVGYVDTTWQDAATVPANAVPDECRAPASNWYSSYDAAAAVGKISKIRMRRLTPGEAGDAFAISTHLKALTAADIPSVPNGTLYKTWGTYRSEVGSTDYRSCDYQSGTSTTAHIRDGCGDRLTLSRSTARIEKITLPGNTANFIPAGGDVTFRLSPTFSSLSGTITDNVFVIDQIPAGAEYVTGSATQAGVPFEPIVTGSVAAGQTLTWDLGVLTVNDPIDPIDFKMQTSGLTPAGTVFTNIARIDAVSDISTVAQRSDERSVTVSSPAGMVMDKSVSVGGVFTDEPIEFTVTYLNGTNANFNLVDVIDILPYNGDGRIPATDFSGTSIFGGVTPQSTSAQFYITKASTAVLQSDPQHISNDFVSGSTPWCPMTALHQIDPSATPTIGGLSAQCPQNAAEITALRIIDTQPLPGSTSRSFAIQLDLSGNAAGDVYSNNAHGSSDGVVFSALSPIASTEVIGIGELEAEKTVKVWDPDNEGLYALPGNEAIYTITIKNIGTGDIDSGSIFLVDSLPPEIEFWNGDIDAGGPDNYVILSSVGFEQIIGTGMIFNPATDLGFSTAVAKPTSFSQCSTMSLDNTYKADIKHICFNPQGSLEYGDPAPTIAFSFRARIE